MENIRNLSARNTDRPSAGSAAGRTYIAIDLKSFYASVECTARGLDALTTNLVVADESRTEKTICLAVSPSLKSYGISGRCRLFEVNQQTEEINRKRLQKAPGHIFTGESADNPTVLEHPELKLGFIIAKPRMALYMKKSTEIYNIYLKYIAPEDIHVYSIDEVFMDVTDYLNTYQMTARELAMKMIRDVLEQTNITATAGIGTNLYLCKIAMDIVAKHIPADENGVRIAELDELTYRKLLWDHTPLTDFWRVGRGYAKKLYEQGLYTMGDIARCSIGSPDKYYNEELLYRLFGINAELLIDHAWGWEPCTMKDIKAYQPENSSIGQGQVLSCSYDFEGARIVVREMTDLLVLDLVDKQLVTDQIVMTVCYDIDNLRDPKRRKNYHGPVMKDHYGREVPKHAHATVNLNRKTSSTKLITDAVLASYDQIVNKELLIRRIYITANHILRESDVPEDTGYEQLDLFTDYAALEKQRQEENERLEKEKKLQLAELAIKKKFGKNAILKGTSFQKGATTMERNQQIGGHKA